MPSELEFISTDDLIDELFNRHDHGGIALMKVDAKPEMNLIERRWKGNPHTIIGLMFDTSQCVMEDMHGRDCDENGETWTGREAQNDDT